MGSCIVMYTEDRRV